MSFSASLLGLCSSAYDLLRSGTCGYGLEDVCDRLDNVEAAVKANRHDLGRIGLVIFVWLALAGFADMWNSKLRYSWWYNVGYDQVTMNNKPTDCNFFHAPLGGKDCHYDRQVSIVKVDSNVWGRQSISCDNGNTWTQTTKNKDGDPIVPNDGGKSWSIEFVPPFTKPGVVVGWEKKDDDN
jgi:hypothetical protein